MSLKKIALILGRRWWALALMAVLGLAAGYGFASIRNEGIEPEFRAEATLVLVRQTDDDSGRILQTQLSEFQRGAIRVNQSILEPGVAEITSEIGETEGTLYFVGFGPTESEATSIATDMRADYLESAPIGVQAVEQDLADYATQVDAIRREIAELRNTEEVDATTEELANRISAELAELRNNAVQLAVELTLYDFREIERPASEIRSELAATQAAIAEVEAELADLQAGQALATETDLRILALEQQEAQITQEYLDLFLNQAEVAALTSAGTVSVAEVSATPISPSLAGLGGLMLGLLVATAGLLLYDFARKPVWSVDDVAPTPVLGSVAPRSRHMLSGRVPWYLDAPEGRRLDDIQTLRAHIDGVLGGASSALGIAGLGAPPAEAKALAADLAASFAVLGDRVLLIDADFDSSVSSAAGDELTLADLLDPGADQSTLAETVRYALSNLDMAVPRLREVHAGEPKMHPTDAVGGKAFETVMAEAKAVSDLVVVVSPEASHSAALTLAQRLDFMLVAAKEQQTTRPELEEVASTLTTRRARFLGIVLMGRRRRLRRLFSRAGRRRKPSSDGWWSSMRVWRRNSAAPGRHSPHTDEDQTPTA